MAPPQSDPAVALLAEIRDLLQEILRVQLVPVRRASETQTEMILALIGAGISPTRTAALLGTTPNTVRVAVSRSKRKG
jgi:DNA-binding CsgD family transcriptional regulator